MDYTDADLYEAEFEAMYADDMEAVEDTWTKPVQTNKENFHYNNRSNIPGTLLTSQKEPEIAEAGPEIAEAGPEIAEAGPVLEFSFMRRPLQLSNTFNKKRKSIGTAIIEVEQVTYGAEQVTYGAEQVTYGAEQVTYGAEQVTYGAEEQQSKRPRASSTDCDRVYSKAPRGESMRVVTDNGKVYLKMRHNITPIIKSLAGADKLLSRPFEQIKAQVMSNYREKQREVQAAVERHKSHVLPAHGEQQLWVNTYVPRTFIELLSDDGVNRQVLNWIKLWDGVVFGRKMKEKAAPVVPKWHNPNWAPKYIEPEYDQQGYPFRKTILLCGPPGLGKTTLAHIIARHAGYNVVEMNASDERSAAQFHEVIENSTQMMSALAADKKPNCLIIDEIDGAGAPAIKVLFNVLSAGPPKTEFGDTKKKQRDKRLKRPIICICNDAYGPALRELRKLAMIVHFPVTQGARLAYRLKSICNREKLTADMATLLYLCEKTDNDIRSSLNTLQFMKTKKEPLTLLQLRSMSIGAKDIQQGMFRFWQSIFTLPKTHKALDHDKSSRHDQRRLYEILKLVYSTGDYDKQMDGIYENYLTLKIKEANFSKVADCKDWMIFYDTLDHEIQHSMVYELHDYLTYVPISFHFFFAGSFQPKVTYPSHAWQNYQSALLTSEIVEAVRSECVPRCRLGMTAQYISTELVSFLTRMLCPNFRPVNIQLYSQEEKNARDVLVAVMASFDLSFVQSKNQDGVVTFKLEPDILSLTSYSGMPEVKQLSFSVKQMLVKEVELKKIGGGREIPKMVVKTSISTKNVSAPMKKVDFSKETVPVDYMAKIVKNKEALNRKRDIYVQKQRTFFKFNEGFSNAVRKPVKVRSFL